MPSVTVIKSREDLLAGTEQEVELVIRTGSTAFKKVSFIITHYYYFCLF
jgi:hypothetical protein